MWKFRHINRFSLNARVSLISQALKSRDLPNPTGFEGMSILATKNDFPQRSPSFRIPQSRNSPTPESSRLRRLSRFSSHLNIFPNLSNPAFSEISQLSECPKFFRISEISQCPVRRGSQILLRIMIFPDFLNFSESPVPPNRPSLLDSQDAPMSQGFQELLNFFHM